MFNSNVTTFHASQFLRLEEPGEATVLVAELSNLGVSARQSPFKQLYDDACDIGFAIRNGLEQDKVYFYVGEPDTDGEDIQGYNCFPCPESIRKNPAIKNLKVLLIND